MFTLDDTIVAISSPAGAAPRAIVRLSGPGAFSLAAAWFHSEVSLDALPGFCWTAGQVQLPLGEATVTLPAKAYCFRGPRSYTRQDLIEIHLPGQPLAAAALLDAWVAAGARRAEPGEFTARAFLSGRIDLSQAQAVADVIHAADESQLRASVATLGGRVHQLCANAAAELAQGLALTEASIDFAEEDLALEQPDVLAATLTTLADHLRDVAANAYALGEASALPRVILAGLANAGKSSLLNALTETDRAITSHQAGTTRDVLTAEWTLPSGAILELIDVAGFLPQAPNAPQAPDDDPAKQACDALDQAADDAARAALAQGDFVLFVLNDAQPFDPGNKTLLQRLRGENPDVPILVLRNQCDQLPAPAPNVPGDPQASELAALPAMATSALTGYGLAAVRDHLAGALHLSIQRDGDAMGLHDRQRRCLLAASEATHAAAAMLADSNAIADIAELVAMDLRYALDQVGQISGEIVTDDILGQIFSQFCVGK